MSSLDSHCAKVVLGAVLVRGVVSCCVFSCLFLGAVVGAVSLSLSSAVPLPSLLSWLSVGVDVAMAFAVSTLVSVRVRSGQMEISAIPLAVYYGTGRRCEVKGCRLSCIRGSRSNF